jgi:hypothetical protein
MKYIKEYNRFRIEKDEQCLLDYIISVNESRLNESIITRLKDVAKKGLLTITLITSLLSSDAFSQEYKTFNNQQKREVVNILKDNNNQISINIGSEFKSGQWKLDYSDKKDIIEKIQILKDFSENYKNHQLKIIIEASESKVPNKDVETGEKLESGQLSEFRFNSAKEIIENILPNIQIVKSVKISGPDWKGDNPNKDEYKKHQYVKLTIVANIESCNLCDAKIDFNGKQSNTKEKFEGINYEIDIKKIDSEGELIIKPGSIPDRAIMYIDGIEVGDTGYFSDKPHQYKDFKLVPLYVYELTKLSQSKSDSKAFNNIDRVNIKTVSELNEILFIDKEFKLEKSLGPEINGPYRALVKMVEDSGDKGIDIVTYKTTPQKIEYSIEGDSEVMIVKVFSPVSKTGFNGYIDCKHKKEIK